MEILASVGISHIRIPYGHWFFDVSEDEPYPAPPQNDDQGLRFYLKRMMGWADELDIKVLLDLHGAPGSQNGFDNSGKRGEIHFQDDDKPDRAARVLGQMSALMKEWIDQGVMRPETLAGIEFLNEPFGWFEPVWQVVREKFYYDGYEQIRLKHRFCFLSTLFISLHSTVELAIYMSHFLWVCRRPGILKCLRTPFMA